MKAASLFETLVVMGIFSMMVVLTFPFSMQLINRSRADAEAKTIAYMLFRQQQDAYAGLQQNSYGIAFFSDRYTVFTGERLSDATYQDTYYFTQPIRISSIQLSVGNEITFPVGEFRAGAFGHITISDSRSTYRLEINSEGMISYYALD